MTDPNSLEFTVPDPWGDLPGYALNALSSEERARVDALLETSPEAREELRQFMEAAENLSKLAQEAVPSARVRRLLLAQADSDLHLIGVAQEEARSVLPLKKPVLKAFLKPARLAYAGTAAAVISVVAIAVIFGLENSRLNSDVVQLKDVVEVELSDVDELRVSVEDMRALFAEQDAEVARLTAVNAAMNEALKDQQWLTYVTQNREYRVPEYLQGGPQAPEAYATLAVKNFDDPAVLLVTGLPPAPEGYQYMLSLVRDELPDSVATFQVNEAGMARVEFQLPNNIVQYESVVVTLEAIDGDVEVLSGLQVMTAAESR